MDHLVDDKKDLEIVVSPECQAEMDKLITEHPEAQEAIRELFANFRQAYAAMQAGQYDSFEDAMEAISGKRPVPLTDD